MGGWPTIKYFNKDTGYEGAHYKKKTPKAMCDELGDNEYMQQYVEEAGHTVVYHLVEPTISPLPIAGYYPPSFYHQLGAES